MTKIWDLHCDALSKMIIDPSIRFYDDPRLDVTEKRLREGCIQLQAFAIYIPEEWNGRPFDAVLASIDAYQRHVVGRGNMIPIVCKDDLEQLRKPNETRIGTMLTLEGAEGLEGNFMYLRIAYQLGIRTLGLTWNDSNWAADGIREPRGGGLTAKGRRLVTECNRMGATIDVSHLSVKGFWDVMELSDQPPIASHSNVRTLCGHPRNLSDDQIRALIATDGRIGITFVPYFLRNDKQGAMIDDVLRHVEYICELGGEKRVGFGSDFDGITEWVHGLEHPGRFETLENELRKRYTDSQVDGFLKENWLSYYHERFTQNENK
jgi:membrane dipeptidase